MRRLLLIALILPLSILYGETPLVEAAVEEAGAERVVAQLPAEAHDSEKEPLATYPYWGQFLKMILTVGGVLTLFVITAILFRQLNAKRASFTNSKARIRIIERRQLSQKTALFLIEIAGKRVLIADTPSGVSALAELPAMDFEESAPLPIDEPQPLPWFQRLQRKFGG